MNIAITFRQLEASEAVKQYASEKVAKLQKFLRKPLSAKVTLSLDKLQHVADVHVHAGSEHFHGSEQSEDMYASIDKVIDKLDRQIRGSKGASQARKRGAEGLKEREVIDPEE
ncbi:MAG: ribosomal subunit interface protein [Sorangium cellulosum]|nr:MAG: ribosomal subunit interface protein [Sorangium cellulosum]